MRNVSPCFLAAVLFSALPAFAQTDPHITSWLTAKSAQYARVYETTSDKTSGNAVSTWPRSGLTNGGGGQATNAYSDIQRVAYSANYVYIYTTGLASYTMGNWLTPNSMTYTSWPTNRAAIHRIPRTASIPTTKQKSNGNGGVLVNGVFVWENGDAQSYSTSTATVSMAGSGIWNRLAGVAEAFNFDAGYGHQPSSGAYHNHINPIALRYQLGDNVTYSSSTKTYSEGGTPTKHSPIIGWANDGLPIYGPYGYASALDAASGVRRMVSGFVKRDGTNGTVNLATTGRVTLPVWAASVQGKSQTLAATEYGPTTTTTYVVGGGVTATYSIGVFAEDYEYLGDLGKTQGVDFDLNRQNVRYCVTPEFPSGTYAYFVCISSAGATVFPDMINQEYFGTAAIGTGTVNSISESVTEYADAGPANAIALTGAASSGSVALTWNSAEGATYKVESSTNNSTWTTLASAVTSGGLTTNYTAATSNYYRVTLTAIATYDTGGTYGTPVGKTATFTYAAAASAPSIATQPTNVTVTAGGSATFTVVASGTAPFTYQWSKGGTAISGATAASYAIASAQAADAGSYTCVVTNSAGSATSNAATLTVNAAATAPSITTQPANVSVVAGSSAAFTVAASGTAPLTYQWSKNGAAIPGATAATYTIPNAQSTDAGSFVCVVTNSAGTATSNAATLTVSAAAVAPTITTQPANVSVAAGGSATFTIVASGTAPLTYQWRKNGTAVSGATAANYVIASAQAADAASYSCVVTNAAGSVASAAATLTVTASAVAPTIATQPASQSVTTGSSVTFTVAAAGTSPFTYQWRKDGAAIAGATAASYAIVSAQSGDAGGYACVITNVVGAVTSATATLTVNAPPAATARLINLAVRAQIGGLAGTPITGVVLGGTGAGKPIIVRAVGPTLANFGVSGALADPQLQLLSGSTVIASNDNWLATDAAAMAAVGAFALSAGSADATIVTTLGPGGYTTPVSAPAGSVGIVLIECYDGATADTSVRLVNASARAFVGAGDGILIPGFVISGSGTVKLLVRAVGPALTAFGVPGVLNDPQLILYQGSTEVASNNDWSTAANATDVAAAATAAGAFALTPGSRDAALLVTLPAGAYTAAVSGVNGTTGTALVEVYVVP